MSEITRNDKSHKQKQVAMHRDFFVRSKIAVENRFYLEALLLEYAAIESRLEIMLGILGYPCNKELPPLIRRRVNISDRIECLRCCVNKNPVIFERSKLPKNYFTKNGLLRKWINDRNQCVHGLYKNVDAYAQRTNSFKRLAINGLEYSRLLYNEVKRLRRLHNNHPDVFHAAICECGNKECVAVKKTHSREEDTKPWQNL